MKTKKFRFVAFWDQVGWVAGTTTFNNVQQGDTLKQAVDRLEWSLKTTAAWYEGADRVPFEVMGLPDTPLPDFADERGTVPVTYRCPVKGRRYSGDLVIKWDPRRRLVPMATHDDRTSNVLLRLERVEQKR